MKCNNAPILDNLSGLKRKPLAQAIACSCLGAGLLISPVARVMAQAAKQEVDEVVVHGHQTDLNKDSTLTKLTEPLRDTPQSITILTGAELEQRGATSLEEALRTVPGITLGAGEFSWQGNNPSLRGFNSRNDMFLDGIRDFGSYARDPFNLEAVEVLQGPSSTVFGRGSTGGVINQSSKKPLEESLTALKVNVGTNDTLRGTVDVSRPLSALGEGAAVRLNLMAHTSETTGREGGEANRYGIAPSLALGLGSPTQLTLSYMRQAGNDTPDYGLPWHNDGRPAEVPHENFYGFDSDFVDTKADILTAEARHEYNEDLSVNSLLRYARYSREMRITEPLIAAAIPVTTPVESVTVDRNVFFGDSEETMLSGQVNATLHVVGGPIDHTLVAGAEAGREGSKPQFGFAIGVPTTNLLEPDQGNGFSATRMETRAIADTVAKSLAVFAIDTMKFGDSWQVLTGLRWDRFDTDYEASRFAGTPTRFSGAGANTTEAFEQSNKEFSYRAALVYKPTESGTFYLATGSSFNPSSESLTFITSGRGLGLGNQLLDPEKNRSYEFGSKWELPEQRININGSVFRISKTNARIPDPAQPGFNQLAGEQQVNGVAVDMAAYVTDTIRIQAGYTYLDGEQLENDRPMIDTPEHSFSTWLTYAPNEQLQLGAGARYVSDRLATNAPPVLKQIPGYWNFDAMGSYQLTEDLLLKLNLTNVTDRQYFTQIHPWHVVPAPGFTAVFAVNLVY